MKKCLPIIFAAFLTVSALTGFAGRNSSSEQNNDTVPTGSANMSAAYEKLIAYKTEDYGQQSIADFNAALVSTPGELTEFLAAEADVISTISPDDENYDFFTTTMSFSAHELYREHMGEEFTFFIDLSKQSRLCDYLDEEGKPVYEFNCFVELNVAYAINAPKLVSVAERDKAFMTFKEEMQNYLNGLSEAEIIDGNIREALTDKAAELVNRLSTENMQLSTCEIYLIDININGRQDKSFSEEEYQKLLALRFDGYSEMTISNYRSCVAELTDTAEYRELLERFSKSETLYELKDTDETASFLFYILSLAGDEWKSRTYIGEVTGTDNTRLEYSFTVTILDADRLMVKDYNDTRLGVIETMQSILINKTKEELRNDVAMQAYIQAYVDDILPYMQTPEMSVAIEFAYFPISETEEEQFDSGWNDSEELEIRRYYHGTKDDYRSLLVLKTPDYQNMPIAEFNSALLAWANEDWKRMERIDEDMIRNDFSVTLTAEELSFVNLTVFLSGMENGRAIQSIYTGTEPDSPYYGEYLPQKNTVREDARCNLYYQFSYNISETEAVTVGERDRQIEGMINAVQTFWSDIDIQSALKMSESDIVKELEKIAATYSTDHITITINKEKIHFERMDERCREIF